MGLESPAALVRNAECMRGDARRVGRGYDVVPGVDVLAVTIFISSCLAAVFVICFAMESKRKNRGSLEHDSLLPLEDGVRSETSDKNTK